MINGKNSKFLLKLNKNEHLIGKTQWEDFYGKGGFVGAQHVVLQKRQGELDKFETERRENEETYKRKIDKKGSLRVQGRKKLAIDDLGLMTMNRNLGPYKVRTMFQSTNYKTYTYLSKMPMS